MNKYWKCGNHSVECGGVSANIFSISTHFTLKNDLSEGNFGDGRNTIGVQKYINIRFGLLGLKKVRNYLYVCGILFMY